MQIIIPMSGSGSRFLSKGFKVPKPMIEVEAKAIIGHVVDMFPGDNDFLFICNSKHVSEGNIVIADLLNLAPGRSRVAVIEPHKFGPVFAVLAARDEINLQNPTVVNYADFNCLWDFPQFEREFSSSLHDGMLVTYRGFHPHSDGENNYAYAQVKNGHVTSVQEKKPFTDNKVKEHTSSGTYAFRTGAMMLEYFESIVNSGQSVGGEFYVSTAIDAMAKSGKSVGVYEIENFMQWGTPEDLAEYEHWSKLFRKISTSSDSGLSFESAGQAIFLASGIGRRFTEAGYQKHKALLEVSGRAVIQQSSRVSPSEHRSFVVEDVNSELGKFLSHTNTGKVLQLLRPSLGQADSAAQAVVQQVGMSGLFTVFSSDTLVCGDDRALREATTQLSGDFIVVWTREPGQQEIVNPHQFGWVSFGPDGARASVKTEPSGKSANIMSGIFTFSSPQVFNRLWAELQAQNLKVNGEFYLDSMVDFATQLGIKVVEFSPAVTISLGTPKEFETFRYWQAVFDAWPLHPYSLEQDPFVDTNKVTSIREALHSTKHAPSEWTW